MNVIQKVISELSSHLHGTGLKARSARGVVILGSGTVVERGLRLARNMILARLLAPDEFGLMAIVMVAAVSFEAFAEVGVKQSIIQNKRGANHDYLNVAWWMQAIRGLGLFLIATVAAPWISSFYDKPELLKLLQVAFLAILFRGLVSPRVYVLEKEFKFGRAVFLVQGSAVLGTIIAIGLALVIRNVWALVIGFVAEAAILCLMSYVLVPFLPRFRIDRKSLSELIRFARGIFGLPFLTMVSMHTDVFVLGKLVSIEQVGMYALALSLARQPVMLFSGTIGRVLLPAFAKKQNDRKALCSAVVRLLRIILLFGVPMTVLAALGARPILSVIYGAKYGAVAVPFAILCFSMLFYAQAIVLAQIYMGIGMPHLHRRYVILLAGLVICLIYPGIKLFGLTGAAGVLLFSNAVAVFIQIIWMKSVIGLKFKDYIYCWWPTSFLRK